MSDHLKRFEAACMRRLRRRELSGIVERGSFWLLVVFALAFLLSRAPGVLGTLGDVVAVLSALVLAVFLLILLWSWVFGRLLWTVRNRLIVTCLLMGLAPVVLFGTLAGVAAYLFAGQFATDTALLAMNGSLERLRDHGSAQAAMVERTLASGAPASSSSAKKSSAPAPRGRADVSPGASPNASPYASPDASAEVDTWIDGQPAPPGRLPATAAPDIFVEGALPQWVQPGFSGVVEARGRLYLCSAAGDQNAGRRTVLALASVPLNRAQLHALARGLGSIFVFRSLSGRLANPEQRTPGESTDNFSIVQGGSVGPPTHFFDRKVYFTAPLHVTAWPTGASVPTMIGVVSRPALLYARLFSTSVHIGALVSDGLIAITILFALLELLALLLAVRLGRTMTRSIGDLYGATMQIDRGNLAHRIPVERRDQLGALATSFNTMAGSLAELLEQQREKQRMQNELAIAQEVQNNLFPHTPVYLPQFELHGVCQPARTVSGDYYDFILSGEGRLCFALGDISGKGISAALLMASLHSAVRAYHAGEPALDPPGDMSPLPSPARLLGLLNRHLYSSTQPEKYATLFLACYDSRTRQLTYANGGHLTPFVMCADGSVERLTCGGSVVGLLEGLAYPEATVELHPGDLVIAYSDGLTEPENEFEEFGEERLLALIRENRHEPLTTLTTHLMRAMQQWIGNSEQPDDMTLVLARQL